jgi:hypothetical protein
MTNPPWSTPSQVTPDQLAEPVAWSSTRLLFGKQAEAVCPVETLSPFGFDVTLPGCPVTVNVTCELPAPHACAVPQTLATPRRRRCSARCMRRN